MLQLEIVSTTVVNEPERIVPALSFLQCSENIASTRVADTETGVLVGYWSGLKKIPDPRPTKFWLEN